MKIYSAIIAIYEELFKQTTLNRNYKLIPNKVDRKLIISYIKWLDEKYHKEEIGVDFLINYFEFQFSHYVGMKTKFNKVIMLNWLIGKKAIERWEKRNPKLKWIVKVRINSEFSLNLRETFKAENQIKKQTEREGFISQTNESEEIYKRRFHDTLKGFVYCQMFTTLYNPKSELCKVCLNREICKETLKTELPKFYKLRIKDE